MIESPRGEVGYYVVSDGTAKPYRVHVRGPSFGNLQAIPEMVKGTLIADVIAVDRQYGFCIGGFGSIIQRRDAKGCEKSFLSVSAPLRSKISNDFFSTARSKVRQAPALVPAGAAAIGDGADAALRAG